jgi:amidohydrolase
MSDIQNQIRSLAAAYLQEVTSIRQYLHRNPELSMNEVNTSAFICSKLQEYGIPFQSGIAKTGITALIEGKAGPGRCIGLRADMDALPIREENKTDYISKNHGVMHACGHDVHMASLLGAAKILNGMRDQFPGSVKLIFQPSEETYPGGAIQMIEAGIMENPKVDLVVGQHVHSLLDAGTAGFTAGMDMASTDEVFLTVKGKGGHAASPSMVIDPILISAHILVALQQIVSRNADPVIPTVISFGKIIGEGRTNIIPDEVRIDGTVRTFDESWRKEIHRKIEKIAKAIAEGMGGSCDVRIAHGYPYLHNDEALTDRLTAWAAEYLGDEKVVTLGKKMTAEDFSYFGRVVPSCFYRLGIRNESKGIVSNLHSATFDVDEASLETGPGLMAWLAYKLLTEKK